MNNTIQSIIRHILTFGGGILVARGLVSETVMTELAGALSGVIGLIWGAFDEYKAEKAAKTQ